jgi:hypothetical protein
MQPTTSAHSHLQSEMGGGVVCGGSIKGVVAPATRSPSGPLANLGQSINRPQTPLQGIPARRVRRTGYCGGDQVWRFVSDPPRSRRPARRILAFYLRHNDMPPANAHTWRFLHDSDVARGLTAKAYRRWRWLVVGMRNLANFHEPPLKAY